MIEILSRENFPNSHSTLEQMFSQRFEIFVKKMKWDLPLAKPGMEKDEYDTDETIYLISRDSSGNINGSLRLSPSQKQNMLRDHFAHLCENEPPTGPDIWEASRCYIYPPGGRAAYSSQVMGEILCAAMETSLIYGIKQVNIISNMIVLPALLNAGWNIKPLGLPQKDGRKSIVALTIYIDPTGLSGVRKRYGFLKPITFRGGTHASKNAA